MKTIKEMHGNSVGTSGVSGVENAVMPKGYLPVSGLTPKYYVEGMGYYNNYDDAVAGSQGFDDNLMIYENPNIGSDNGLGWDSMKGKGGLALGGAQFGLGLAGFLDQKKTAKLQRDLMSQQLASNTETLANKRADRAHAQKVFSGGGGLTSV